jgi:Domain of unknown function (DUF4232)
MRVMLGTAAAAALLAACGGAPAMASEDAGTRAPVTRAPVTRAAVTGSAAAGPTVTRCLRHELSAGLHGSQAGLGNRGMLLTLTNVSGRSCSLDGYPGLGLQNAAHQVLRSHTSWGSTYFSPDPGRHFLVLSPGETVSASLAYGAGDGQPHPVHATYLEVTPPNAYLHLTVRLPGGPASIYRGRLFVTAVARHTPF